MCIIIIKIHSRQQIMHAADKTIKYSINIPFLFFIQACIYICCLHDFIENSVYDSLNPEKDTQQCKLCVVILIIYT